MSSKTEFLAQGKIFRLRSWKWSSCVLFRTLSTNKARRRLRWKLQIGIPQLQSQAVLHKMNGHAPKPEAAFKYLTAAFEWIHLRRQGPLRRPSVNNLGSNTNIERKVHSSFLPGELFDSIRFLRKSRFFCENSVQIFCLGGLSVALVWQGRRAHEKWARRPTRRRNCFDQSNETESAKADKRFLMDKKVYWGRGKAPIICMKFHQRSETNVPMRNCGSF